MHLIGLPTGTNFSAGFTFKFKDGEDIVKIAKSNSSVNVALNKYLDLGDITSHLEDYVAPTTSDHKSGITDASDLSVGGTANCYVISAAGAYKLPVVKGNSDQSAGNVFGVELLWETYNNAEEVTPNSVIAAVDFDGEENYVYFQTPATLKPGNALIAAKNFEGAIIWSWHIWIPETAFTSNTYGYTTDCEIMSRNLGALADTQPGEVADPKSFGLLYQWGRKDPFLGVKAAGSTESATFYGTAMTVFDGQMSQAEAAAQPTVLANVSGIDWCSTVDRMYWGDQEKSGSKTIYDPCPAGYRVAGRKRAKIFTDAGSGLAGWSYDAEKYYFQVGAPVSTLPLCGYLKEDGTYATDAALVWNTHMDADTPNISYCQWVSSGESKKGQKERAKGGSIRCETIPAE